MLHCRKLAIEREKYAKKQLEAVLSQVPTNTNSLNQLERDELSKIVNTLISPGKGLLSINEDNLNTIVSSQKVSNIYVNLTHPQDELFPHLTGIILNDKYENLGPHDIGIIEFLRLRKLVAGVSLDKGVVNIFSSENEFITQGLDDLKERCIRYKRDGCHFAKWKSIYTISDVLPSKLAITTNAIATARYASICQNVRMVPIIEVEISDKGADHDIDRSLQVHEELLSVLFRTLQEYHVYLEAVVLMTTMVLPGKKHNDQSDSKIIGDYTMRVLKRTVPVAVPAILFSSTSRFNEPLNSNLQTILNYEGQQPWNIGFSYE